MRTYMKIYFSTEGPSSISIAERFKQETGLSFIRGDQDVVFPWKTNEEYKEMMEKIYRALQGSKAFVTYQTEEEDEGAHFLAQWPPRARPRTSEPRRTTPQMTPAPKD